MKEEGSVPCLMQSRKGGTNNIRERDSKSVNSGTWGQERPWKYMAPAMHRNIWKTIGVGGCHIGYNYLLMHSCSLSHHYEKKLKRGEKERERLTIFLETISIHDAKTPN